MTDWYNLTAVNATGLVPLMQTINENYAGHQLGNVILVIIFFLTIISAQIFNNNTKINLMVSFFITFLFSVFFIIFRLTQPYSVFISFAGFVVSLVVAVWMK